MSVRGEKERSKDCDTIFECPVCGSTLYFCESWSRFPVSMYNLIGICTGERSVHSEDDCANISATERALRRYEEEYSMVANKYYPYHEPYFMKVRDK